MDQVTLFCMVRRKFECPVAMKDGFTGPYKFSEFQLGKECRVSEKQRWAL